MSAHDYFPHGMPFAEGKQLAIWAEVAGADAIHVSGGHYRSLPSAAVMVPPMAMGSTPFIDYATEIQRSVGVPVIVGGAFGDPAVAAGAISDGVADFVALGRAVVADPDWLQNAQRGIPVRTCLPCSTCVDSMRAGSPASPENSCGAPKVVMMQSMDCRELDYFTLFWWTDRSAIG